MREQVKNLRKTCGVDLLFFAGSFLLLGLFKEYAGCLYTGIWGVLCLTKKRALSSRKENRNLQENGKRALPVSCFDKGIFFCVLAIALFYLLTCLYGVDGGMSLIGFLKFMSVPFFFLYLTQMTEEERRALRALVPVLGCFMTILGIAGRFVAPLHSFFYVENRLGGFFQYPNVFALFCLVGILLLLEGGLPDAGGCRLSLYGAKGAQACILLAGILLSGSRTVFFLTVLAAFLVFLHFPQLRKVVLILLVLAGLLIAAIVGITGNVQNVGRFLTTSLSSSTLVGRVIYWLDGLRELARRWFGLGYLGYYYREPLIRRAFYEVRFIHNDFLQLALDVGILPALGFAAAFIRQLWKRELPFARRIALLVMLLHFWMDFDLEFTAMWYLLLLLAARPQAQSFLRWEFPENMRKWVFPGATVLCCMVSFYVGLAMLPVNFGNAGLSARLLPFYTEANVQILSEETDAGEAQALAQKILRQNSCVPEAYDIQAVIALAQRDYEGMVEAKESSLALQTYGISSYERYLELLAQAISLAAEEGDSEGVETLLQAVVRVPEMLEEVEEQTIDLAYKIQDVPNFTLSEWAQEFVQEAEESLLA